MKSLLFGYGNIDRQDDGVAWHILRGVAQALDSSLPIFPEETDGFFTPHVAWAFALQLTPESAELVSQYDQVIFIDAHTGSVEEPLHVEILNSEFQTSPFTHHLTPQTCLTLAGNLFGNTPRAWLVSVHGYEFGFSQTLSSRTDALNREAVAKITSILHPDG